MEGSPGWLLLSQVVKQMGQRHKSAAGSGCYIRVKVRKQGTSSQSEALAEVIQEHNRCVHRAWWLSVPAGSATHCSEEAVFYVCI